MGVGFVADIGEIATNKTKTTVLIDIGHFDSPEIPSDCKAKESHLK